MNYLKTPEKIRQEIIQKVANSFRIQTHLIDSSTFRNPKSPYDLVFARKRYQIKMANPSLSSKKKLYKIWDFDVRKNETYDNRNHKKARIEIDCDYFILVGMEEDIIQKMFLLPVSESPSSHIRISIEGYSKYQKYEIKEKQTL
jgi:hypothetical protein